VSAGSRRGVFKVIALILPSLVILGALEMVQRVRYSLRAGTTAWLFYGLVEPPTTPAATATVGTSTGTAIVPIGELLQNAPAPNATTIVCVGGSTTAGVFNPEIADSHGAEFIDLQPDFEHEDLAANFVDPAHLTDAGNLRLSRLIVERSKTLQRLLPAS
jgi:hypothetical protein